MDIINPHLYLIDGEYYINYGSTKKMFVDMINPHLYLIDGDDNNPNNNRLFFFR